MAPVVVPVSQSLPTSSEYISGASVGGKPILFREVTQVLVSIRWTDDQTSDEGRPTSWFARSKPSRNNINTIYTARFLLSIPDCLQTNTMHSLHHPLSAQAVTPRPTHT